MGLPEQVRALIFDFGGTLDVPGRHWAHVISEAYAACGVNVSPTVFRDAYIYGERALALPGAVWSGCTFDELMHAKIRLEMRYLVGEGAVDAAQAVRCAGDVAEYCLARAREGVSATLPVVETLSRRFRMGVASNFYGNLPVVLRGFGLGRFFDAVADSAALGVRKPDPEIFLAAARMLGVDPEHTAVIGDSIVNDIRPAVRTGSHAVLVSSSAEPGVGISEGCEIVRNLWELVDTKFKLFN